MRQVRQLQVPALVLHGALDMRPSWPAQELAELLPSAEFVLLGDAGHFPWVEEPTAVQVALRSFVSRLDAAAY